MEMNRSLLGLLLASTLVLALSGCATSANRPVKANPADVDSIADIVRASYETISGPAKHPWPWDRDCTLYMPKTVLVSNSVAQGRVERRIQTSEDYGRTVLTWTTWPGF